MLIRIFTDMFSFKQPPALQEQMRKPEPTPPFADALEKLDLILARVTRIETRLVLLMHEHGMDCNGKPLDQ
jgi:hypothetical protein